MDETQYRMRVYAGYLGAFAATEHLAAVRAVLGEPQLEAIDEPKALHYGVDTFDEARALVDRLRAAGLHDGRLTLILNVQSIGGSAG